MVVPIDRQIYEDGTVSLRLKGVVTERGQEWEQIDPEDYGRRLLVSFCDVTLLNSTGISGLLNINRQVHQHGGRLVLHSLSPLVAQVMKFMKLDQLLVIAKGEREARQMLS